MESFLKKFWKLVFTYVGKLSIDGKLFFKRFLNFWNVPASIYKVNNLYIRL